jgi:hypothetical protein
MFSLRSLGRRERASAKRPFSLAKMVLPEGIELSTSPLPRKSATRNCVETMYYVVLLVA